MKDLPEGSDEKSVIKFFKKQGVTLESVKIVGKQKYIQFIFNKRYSDTFLYLLFINMHPLFNLLGRLPGYFTTCA